jgi:long-subunit acyl-CoA synthetase (AMP-forming)
MIIYTSGSTGFPKGRDDVPEHVAAATSITTYLENRETRSRPAAFFDYGSTRR